MKNAKKGSSSGWFLLILCRIDNRMIILLLARFRHKLNYRNLSSLRLSQS